MQSRSREGAWIEIIANGVVGGFEAGRSREGAWIEMRRSVSLSYLR